MQVGMEKIKEEQEKKEKRRKRQAGVTLIELLVVVTILAIVSGIGFTLVGNQIDRSRDSADLANVRSIADAVQRYLLDNPNGTGLPADGASANITSSHVLVTGGYLGQAPANPYGATTQYSIERSGKNIIVRDVDNSPDDDITLNNVLP
ncbi:hypothetical protein EFBL_0109 [Effusibacillus lacus]|uniref:Prepilin-type N-terminal cleavage/methylation domain-containing protein n=1 Tax=Effusibacillus lacus TaxID=1348429 RepID=A0A292YJ49_9BACL|nr:hypothetical protein EFBL_0109 [Effusibacillus lacus]